MDIELYNEAIKSLYEDPNFNLKETLKELNITDFLIVSDKYLYVYPPVPGIICSDKANTINRLSMKYNQLYNLKHNFNPNFDLDYLDSEDEENTEQNLDYINPEDKENIDQDVDYMAQITQTLPSAKK